MKDCSIVRFLTAQSEEIGTRHGYDITVEFHEEWWDSTIVVVMVVLEMQLDVSLAFLAPYDPVQCR